MSKAWSVFMEKLEISVSLMSGYRSQSNGQIVCAHQEITSLLPENLLLKEPRELGLGFSHVRSTPKIPITIPPPTSPHSSMSPVTSYPCSCGMPIPLNHSLSVATSSRASRCGNVSHTTTHTHTVNQSLSTVSLSLPNSFRLD